MKIQMTRDGYDRLAKELENLKSVERPKNLEEVKHARSYGDLRENAEYDYARQQQGLIEARIRELEAQLSMAHVVEEIDTSKISVGVWVKLLDQEYDEEMEYAILDSGTAPNGLEVVSPLSPIGQALMDKGVGDEVQVPVPSGTLRLKVLEIHPLQK
ncbi:MAG: transcription elongation factor GreA [Armatimonadetes bacterium]|nr:transcription elongation factor GreA [Armatimonadota bacterium]